MYYFFPFKTNNRRYPFYRSSLLYNYLESFVVRICLIILMNLYKYEIILYRLKTLTSKQLYNNLKTIKHNEQLHSTTNTIYVGTTTRSPDL